MSTIVLRGPLVRRLTIAEVDANFNNLNNDKLEKDGGAFINGTINNTTIGATTAASGRFTSLTTDQTTFNLINATATTLNIGGAATTIGIGAATGTLTINNEGTVFNSNKYIKLPVGDVSQRPGSASNGMLRYNSEYSHFEGYQAGSWSAIGGVKSADGLTYIVAESSDGNSNDELEFYAATSGIATSKVGGWNQTRLLVNTPLTVGGDLTVDTNTLFVDSTNNRVGIGTITPVFDLEIIASSSAAGGAYVTAVGAGSGTFNARHARGTIGSPTASQLGDNLGTFGARGYGSTGFSSTSRAGYKIWAAENWTDSAQGSYLTIYTTAAGGTTTSEKMRIDASGNVGVGNTPSGTYKLEVTGAGYYSSNLTVGGTLSVTGHPTLEGVTATGATGTGKLVFDTTPTFTTSIDGGATFAAFGSSTALTIGYNSTASSTTNINTNATATGNTKTINIGTGSAAGSTTNINLGTAGQAGTVTINKDLTVTGDLIINGTTTNINTTNLVVEDKNIILGDVTTPSNTTADGGGITLKGLADKTLNWVNSTSAWTSSADFNLLTGKVYEINGTSVLSATALGSGVTGSSLTSVGTIGTGVWQGTTVGVGYGGTGTSTAFTAGSVVFAGGSGVYTQDNANLFWDDSNNRLGIGTTTPVSTLQIYAATASQLTVSGDAGTAVVAYRSSTDATGSSLALRKARGTTASQTAVASGDQLGILTFQGYGGTNVRNLSTIQGFVSTYTSDTDISSILTFATSGTGGAFNAERMRIDSSGNVGIGTSSPASRLTVKSASSGDGIFIDRSGASAVTKLQFRNEVGSNSTSILNVGTSDAMAFETGGAVERMRITSAGAVVIGNGETSATPAAGVLEGTDGSGTNIAGASLTLQGGRGTGTGAGGALLFQTSPAGTTGTSLNAAQTRMAITSAGNVGIGTASPASRLQVIQTFGNSFATSLNATAAGSANNQLAGISFSPTFANTADFGPRRAADIWAGFNAANWGTQYLAFGVGNVTNDAGDATPERMRIDSAGNVGIGTNSPSSYGKFSVVGTAGQLFTVTDSLSGTLFSVNDVSGIPSIEVIDTGVVKLAPYSGNVGIGTHTPAYKFDVTGNARITGATLLSSTLAVTGTATLSSTLAVTGNTILNSNVGISTPSPTARLHLPAGTASASTAPLKFTSGTNLGTVENGVVEYDGSLFYATPTTTNGRGVVPVTYYNYIFTETATATTISPYFGANTAIPLVGLGVYEIEFVCWFLKNTSGTLVWTITNSTTVNRMHVQMEMSPITGVTSTNAASQLFAQLANQTAASVAFAATGSLTTGVNHYARFRISLRNDLSTSIRLNVTNSAGTITPLIGSYYKVIRLANSGALSA